MRLKNIHLLMLLAICWGPSFLFIKIALEDLSPLVLSIFRIGLGALILNVILLFKGNYLPRNRKFWINSAVAALFSVALPFLLINWGQQFIDSSLGSLLNGSTPFFTVLFSVFLLNNETTSQYKVRGIIIGFIGLMVLVYPNLRDGVTASFMGILAVILASASYGLGWVWVKKRLTGIASFIAPAAQLLIAVFYLIPVLLFSDTSTQISEIKLATVLSVVGLGVLGTAIAFILYFKLIERAGASYASMVTYLVPVIGVLLGTAILNESITLWMLAGAALIFYGIFTGSRSGVAEIQTKKTDLSVFTKFR